MLRLISAKSVKYVSAFAMASSSAAVGSMVYKGRNNSPDAPRCTLAEPFLATNHLENDCENFEIEVDKQRNVSDSSLTRTAKPFQEQDIVPIMQATTRALRLMSTVVTVIMEYKIHQYYQEINEGFHTLGLDVLTNENAISRQDLEKEVLMKSIGLQDAQNKYAEPKEDIGDGKEKPRSELLRKEVYKASKRLSEAEQRLSYFDEKCINDEEEFDASSGSESVHTRCAKRIRDLCRRNGGTYVKVGQHLANLDHLLPPEYITILHSLFGDAPVTPYNDVREVIKEELGFFPEDIFEKFEQDPIASASLAQVHIAVERNTGRKLAVKVQHRGLRETSTGDLLALEYVMKAVDGIFDDFQFGWIADEIAPNLPKELDFCNEGKNAEKAAAHFSESGIACVVPKIHWDFSTPRVLCMDFEEGFSITDIEQIVKSNVKKSDLSTLVSKVFQAQIFQSGFIHCDPHPANVFWRKTEKGKPELVLFDHGLYKQIDNNFRLNYANLWRSLLVADIEKIKESCHFLGIDDMYPLLSAMLLSRPFDEIIERSKTNSFRTKTRIDSKSDAVMIRGYAQQYLKEIVKLLDKVPRQMLLIFKMNDCLRHIGHTLGSNNTNELVVAGKYAAKEVYKSSLSSKESTIIEKLKLWCSFIMLMSRIKCYELRSGWIR
mmetsp:Transcript_24075/g.29649  ORF Transcript_24075/g.29649 Transcript_24075/m.29649 type:complete len:661 (+) Transcript_24075:141-2123(+)